MVFGALAGGLLRLGVSAAGVGACAAVRAHRRSEVQERLTELRERERALGILQERRRQAQLAAQRTGREEEPAQSKNLQREQRECVNEETPGYVTDVIHTTQQPTHIIINTEEVTEETIRSPEDNAYHWHESIILGAIQILLGFSCAGVNIAALHRNETGYLDSYTAAPGIWCGFMFIVAGALAIHAGNTRLRHHINASMGLNIVTNILAVVLIIWAAISLPANLGYRSYDYGYPYNRSRTRDSMAENIKVSKIISWLFISMGLCVFVVTTWLYILACCNCCQCQSDNDDETVLVITRVVEPMTAPYQQHCQMAPPSYACATGEPVSQVGHYNRMK